MPDVIRINNQIAELFRKKAEKLRGKGEKYVFRARAYERAATSIERLDRGVDEIYQHGWLVGVEKIEGVGNRLAHEIETELIKNNLVNKK
jgi:DNA polymerase/3'-5' exonuclease PolX